MRIKTNLQVTLKRLRFETKTVCNTELDNTDPKTLFIKFKKFLNRQCKRLNY